MVHYFEFSCMLESLNSAEIPYIGYDWEAENLVVSMILVVFMCNDVSLHSSHFIIVKQFFENLDCVK